MHDSELKKLLLETCPVRPGQEARAWEALRERLSRPNETQKPWAWLYFPTWRGATIAFTVVCVLAFLGNSVIVNFWPKSFASANSEAPGIYATSFYSHSAKAQVVWLNGLGPASDNPADNSSQGETKAGGDPNSL